MRTGPQKTLTVERSLQQSELGDNRIKTQNRDLEAEFFIGPRQDLAKN